MKKTIMIIILIAVIIGIITAVVININKNSTKDENGTKLVRLNEVTRSVFYAPQYVAIAQGYFKEKGIEVEITTGQGADKVMTAVYVYNEGKEDHTQVFAQLTKRDGSFLVARDKTDEFDWNQLKGKTVIPGRKGGVPYMTFEYVLKQKGKKPKYRCKLR